MELIFTISCLSDNFLSQTNPGSLYRDSWPSLFVAPAGIASELHVDAFASSFWMALFHGEKRLLRHLFIIFFFLIWSKYCTAL